MRTATLFFMLAWTGFAVLAAVAQTDGTKKDTLHILEKKCLQVRDLQAQLADLTEKMREPDHAKQEQGRRPLAAQLIKEFDVIKPSENDLGVDFFRYFRARLEIMAGNWDAARKTLVPLSNSETLAPEAIDALSEIDTVALADNREGAIRRTYYWHTLGRLLPVGGYGKSVDAGLTEYDADADQPIVPSLNKVSAIEVAHQFFEMKMYSYATMAYLEAIYGIYPPSKARLWYWDSWLSAPSAPLWLKAAQAQWQLGRADVAVNYIAKAIVFGSEVTKGEALNVLAAWKESGLPPQSPAAIPDAEKLKGIAQHYARMFMHPRAIKILHEFEKSIGAESIVLRERYEKEWVALLEAYCDASVDDKCYLFGQNVSQVEDRLKVIIPPPLRKEALEEAAKTIQELSLKAGAQPTN